MKVFNKLFADIQESYSELVYKVSWPTRTQLVNSAMIVLVASIILSLIIWGVDEVINFIMETIYGLHIVAQRSILDLGIEQFFYLCLLA